MKKVKEKLGEPLSWNDYLSCLPFTQAVSYIHSPLINFMLHLTYITRMLVQNVRFTSHNGTRNQIRSMIGTVMHVYVQVITETLRLGNIIIGVMRKAVKDVEIKGHLIPKGWCVLAHFRSVHMDQHLYDFPYTFNPWRWEVRSIFYFNIFLLF